MSGLQKMGGVAALAMAAAWVVAFAVLIGILMPAGYFDEGVTAIESARIIADNQALASISYLIPYVAFGILLVVLALALYDLLKVGAPAVAQIATAIGLIWAGLVIASGMVAILGIRVVGELYGTDAAQAAAVWAPVDTIVGGLGGEAGEILGGVWLLLIGWAALRARELPRPLSFLGIVLGVAGILTVVPPLEPAAFLYGLGLIVWFVWLGFVMLRTSQVRASRTLARAARKCGHEKASVVVGTCLPESEAGGCLGCSLGPMPLRAPSGTPEPEAHLQRPARELDPMHRVIDIHLTGHADPLRVHEDAYDAISGYLADARSRLADDPDQAEVMGDLERSIGAKLMDRLGSGDRILTVGDVTDVLHEVGPVGTDDGRLTPVVAERPRRRRLYRITEGQDIAGVCSGLAIYSEVRVDYIRTIFVLLALVTAGLFALVYFAIAFVLPVVPTRAAWIAQMEIDEGT